MANSQNQNMIRIAPILIAVACAVAVLGCSAQLDGARRAAQASSAFNRALQTGYLQLAQAEFDEFDLVDTDFFAGQALKLAYGQRINPERLDARKLPAVAASESFRRARARSESGC